MKTAVKRNLIVIGALLLLIMAMSLTACGTQFDGKTLESGKVGVEYSVSIASGNKDVIYYLDYENVEGDEMPLPEGLDLSEDGTISGTPEEAVTKTFKVIEQKADDYNSYKEAEFTITIAKGTIVYNTKALPDAKTDEGYSENLGFAAGAKNIKYEAKNNELPKGLTLDADGKLHGYPEEVSENKTFTVIASASHCDSAEATFAIKIEEGDFEYLGYIKYTSFEISSGTTGEEYNANLGMATGVRGITYKFKASGGIALPNGLTVDKYGKLSGIPKNSTDGQISFYVVASAEGYDSVQAMFSINILDKYEETNKFEAEYINVNGLFGSGTSGTPSGKGLIQIIYNKASNHAALGYLHTSVTFKFEFTSSKASSGKLMLRLGTETGNLTTTSNATDLTKQPVIIRVNGVALDYGTFTIQQIGTNAETEFQTFVLSPNISLKEGDNEIEFQIMPVREPGEGTALADGPIFDYIQINDSDATIGWRPRKTNIG